MAGVDAGDRLPCPSCRETVLQKAMIPVLGEDGTGMRYLCISCARQLIVHTEAEAGGPDDSEGAAAESAEAATAGATGAETTGAAGPTGEPRSEPAAPAPAPEPA